MIHPVLSALFDFNISPQLVAIVVPVCGLIFAGVVVVTAMYFRLQRQRQWHETARLALEKGQPIPVPLSPPDGGGRRPEQSNDLRSGLVLIGVGVGLYVFLGTFLGRGLGYVGAIPGCIGIGLLLNGLFTALTAKRKAPTDERPLQS